ncbi:hypothetical protein [Actinosynnema sp. ALI-1.44]|uniref:hypothetical protein n=1 Tax=Actinosynnema sp. ALI-1.44 TaxID=1933779 RepID=UPI002E8E42CA|nr:hypothetical protein [Actinosynnema sp. ALI-1.44]
MDEVRALLAETVQRGFSSPSQLIAELEEGSDRGSAVPRRVLAEIDGGVRSAAEGMAWRLWKRSGLPECRWNVDILTADGRVVARPDAWFDDVGLAWEIDSKEFHFTSQGYASTLRRNNRYAAAGVVVVQTLPSSLRSDPESVVNDLKAAYRVAKARPRPTLTHR